MTKGRIIVALVVLAVAGLLGAGHVLYFSPKLKAYEQDERFLKSMEALAQDLEDSFYQTKPDVIMRAWRGQVQPWNDAIAERAQYFNFSDWYLHDRPPEEGGILRFWYQETSNKMIVDLYDKVAEKIPRYDLFPENIRTTLDIKNAEDFSAADTDIRSFNQELGRLSFGISAAELLLDNRASSVQDIILWPPRNLENQNFLLRLQTIGVAYTMILKDFVDFMDKLRSEDRYLNVDSIQVSYPYIMDAAQPHLNVKMLLTQASFIMPEDQYGEEGAGGDGAGVGADGAGGAGAAAAPGGARRAYSSRAVSKSTEEKLAARRQRAQAGGSGRGANEEPGRLGKAWRWFRKVFIPF